MALKGWPGAGRTTMGGGCGGGGGDVDYNSKARVRPDNGHHPLDPWSRVLT